MRPPSLLRLFNIDVNPILIYYEKTWINGDFTPDELNQFGIYQLRTNKNMEIYNNQVNTQLWTQPSLERCYEYIRDQENKMSLDVLRADLHISRFRKKK